MTDIVEVADGQLIEPPLTVEQRLEAHCAYAEKDFTNGDYFHLLAKDAAALIASQARRIRELEEGVEPFDEAFGFMLEGTDDYQSEEPVTLTCGRNTTHFLVLGHFRRARSLLSRKGGE